MRRSGASSPSTSPPLLGRRTVLYAAGGLLLGAVLTVAGYLVDFYLVYGELPASLSIGVVRGLHDVTPVHYFADLFALILALVGGVAGWFQDRLRFYSSHLEDLVEARTRDLRKTEERYALAVQGSNDGIWDWDLVTDEVYYAPRWRQMVGCDDEIRDRPEDWLDRIHADDVENVRQSIQAHLEGASSHVHVEYRIHRRDGSYCWMLARAVAVRDSEGRPTRLAGSQTDINVRRKNEDQLRYLAVHDRLTDLPNRALLLDRVGQILRRRDRRSMSTAVLHVGIDRFKKINESLGSHIGDQILVETGNRLSKTVADFEGATPSRGSRRGPTGSVFRVEGDEFASVLQGVRSVRDATRLANRILEGNAGPVEIDGHEVLTSLSIGITVGPRDYTGVNEILRDARTAMNRAKVRGRARYEVFDDEMLETVEETMHLETELFQALEKRQLRLSYQPIVSLGSNKVVGFEALTRWEHPERGYISPERFISLAEETGLIVPMTRWLFEEAFDRLKQWQERFKERPDLSININLSPKYLFHPDLESDLATLLRKASIDPSRIHLEITESSFIDRPRIVAELLCRLKKWGFLIALDDFGTGYSSLSILHELPFDILKIDRGFISKMIDDPNVRTIVGSIVSLARELGLEVVAEGIETAEQLEELRSAQCKYGQGSLLGQAMSVDAAEKLLESVCPKAGVAI